MKKILVLAVALLAAISCGSNSTDAVEDVVITTLEGSSFSLSEFGVHTFPATDTWIIDDQSATAADFEGLSYAIEYISGSDTDRQIELIFSALTEIPAYAIFGQNNSGALHNLAALYSIEAEYVTSIGARAFEYCSGLRYIDFPLAQSIGDYAFYNCVSLKELDLPTATQVGNSAFNGCISMLTLSIPSVQSIGTQAFNMCDSLVEISLGAATTIGSGAFAYCTELISFEAPVLIEVGSYAFCEATALTDLSIPLVEQVGDYAFVKCESLESYTLTGLVSSIGVGLFNGCSAMAEIVVESANTLYLYDAGILYDAAQSAVLASLISVVGGDITLPATVTSLTERVFYGCTGITSIELPAVTELPQMAFAYCSSLESISLPVVTDLLGEALYDCTSLSSFEAPQLLNIGARTFYNCDNIADLSIATADGVMIESIDEQAFYGAYIAETYLTMSSANAEYVSYGGILTVGDFADQFAQITLL